MTSKELRQLYLDFFRSKGHAVIESASLIPENDPTVLFTTAGMHPLVPYLMGEKHPEGTRLTDVQKCLRTGDIDEVGDASHCTFFEMLGNWSLGDYFKKESIAYSWEFLTGEQWLGIDPDRLYFTCFAGDADAPQDTVAHDRWVEMGVDPSHIVYLPKKNNWWGPAGQTGPCGPDTEIFFDTGRPACGRTARRGATAANTLRSGTTCSWSTTRWPTACSNRSARRTWIPAWGSTARWRRCRAWRACTTTDAFTGILAAIARLSGKGYRDDAATTRAFRIVADHIRSATFLLGDQRPVTPSNVDQGYILRRLIRRAIRYAMQLGIPEGALHEVAEAVVDQYGGFYRELEPRARDHRIRIEQGGDALCLRAQKGHARVRPPARAARRRAHRGARTRSACTIRSGFPI